MYTGITPSIEKRLQKHLSGKGSRYLRGRSPLKLVYREARIGRSSALKSEARIKSLTRIQKLELIHAHSHKP